MPAVSIRINPLSLVVFSSHLTLSYSKDTGAFDSGRAIQIFLWVKKRKTG